MSQIEITKQLISKGVDLLGKVMKLYDTHEKTHTKITAQEFIQTFEGIKVEDLKYALNLLNNVKRQSTPFKQPTIQNITSILNEQPTSHHTHINNDSNTQNAKHLMQAILLTTTSETFPSVDKLINTLNIKDTKVKEDFIKEYNKVLPVIKPTLKENPVDSNLYFWSRIGQIAFYGGVVVVILIILRKIYEFFIDLTDAIRNKISHILLAITKVLKPERSRYIFSLFKFFKKRKKHKTSILPQQLTFNINQNLHNKKSPQWNSNFNEQIEEI